MHSPTAARPTWAVWHAAGDALVAYSVLPIKAHGTKTHNEGVGAVVLALGEQPCHDHCTMCTRMCMIKLGVYKVEYVRIVLSWLGRRLGLQRRLTIC